MKNPNINMTEQELDQLLKTLCENDGILKPENNQKNLMTNIDQFKTISETDTDEAWKKLHSRFEKDGLLENAKQTKSFNIRRITAVAATIAVFFVLSISVYFYLQQPDMLIVSARSEIKTLILPDGSEITLNIGSQISYPEEFTEETRHVNLQGEAFFNVAKNEKQAFIVKADKTEIRVVGTQFNVKTDTENTEVVVSEGHLQFYTPSEFDKRIDLLKGEAGFYKNNTLSSTKNQNPNASAWKTKIVTISPNMNLLQVINDLNKAYRVNIEIKNPGIGNIRPSPTVFNNYSINEILQIPCTQSNLKMKTEGDTILISVEK